MNVEDYGPRLTAEAFIEIDFGERIKAKLEDGQIRVLERGPRSRVYVADNLLVAVGTHLRGSGKRTYGSSLALKTGRRSVRFPDVAVYDGDRVVARYGDRDLMADPSLAAHVCNSERASGRIAAEYKRIASLKALLVIDYERKLVRSFIRLRSADWQETLVGCGQSNDLPPFSLVIPHATIFMED